MASLGENIIKIQGKISKLSIKTYQNDSTMFKCKVAVPTPSGDGTQYISTSVWGTLAEQLCNAKNGDEIRIYGHLENHSFKTKCRYCNGPTTVYWTTVVIDNYILLGEEYE